MTETAAPSAAARATPARAGVARGWWSPQHPGDRCERGPEALCGALLELREPVCVLEPLEGRARVAIGGGVRFTGDPPPRGAEPVAGYAPPVSPARLGDAGFLADHGVRFPYMAGAMANGISSPYLVEAMAEAGMLGSYGAAGRPPSEVEAAIERITARVGDGPCCFNLIHSPNEPGLEEAVADLYVRRGVQRVEASAYLDLTLPAVRYRVHGIHRAPDGRVRAPNRIIAKVSRVEVARKWLSPPPPAMLAALVERGEITAGQAAMAAGVPMAGDLTAEADSGGHTDNQPAVTLLPTMTALRDRLSAEHGYESAPRVGLAGGIATPASAAAAFAMGAAYVVTGSINQACTEAGTSDRVRRLLAEAGQADVAMAPAADMFEMGVRLQVLKRGTMFAMRASRLLELYRGHDSLESLPASERENLERTVFQATFDEVWAQTRRFFEVRDAAQIERAERSPKHRMALVFRWYLGQSSAWANAGDPARQVDYQIWCGPAMGAFNEWVRGSLLEPTEHRHVATLALNILYGAAVLARAGALRAQGAHLGRLPAIVPASRHEIEERLP